MTKQVCAVLGAGPGNGVAIARRFAEGGYATALCARNAERTADLAARIDAATAYSLDVTDPVAVERVISSISEDLGPIETLVYNAGSGSWGSVDDVGADQLIHDFNVNAAGLVSAVRAVLPGMRERGSGNIVVIGASAAWRGRPGTISFAAAKSGQRSVAQSLARQLGPENIHVSYLILDGVIDLESTKARMADKPDTFFMAAKGVADAAWSVTRQDRQAWTFELDLRPYAESW